MAKTDASLGIKISNALVEVGLEGPYKFPQEGLATHEELRVPIAELMRRLGIDLNHESTRDSPTRFAKMYKDEIFYGINYNNFPAIALEDANGFDEIILERNIKVHSTCAHHFVPIVGVAHVAYLPGSHLLGLSKINRIVDFFSRRPQLQERLGEQIALALKVVLETEDVAVIIKADHYCVKFRGVADPCSDTITSVMSGRFRDVPVLRSELMALITM